jgi:hypothetical protein
MEMKTVKCKNGIWKIAIKHNSDGRVFSLPLNAEFVARLKLVGELSDMLMYTATGDRDSSHMYLSESEMCCDGKPQYKMVFKKIDNKIEYSFAEENNNWTII